MQGLGGHTAVGVENCHSYAYNGSWNEYALTESTSCQNPFNLEAAVFYKIFWGACLQTPLDGHALSRGDFHFQAWIPLANKIFKCTKPFS